MRIFAPVWGETHLDWFKKGALQSLSWPENAKAIKDAEWILASTSKDLPTVMQMVGGIENVSAFIQDDDSGMPLIQKGLIMAVEEAIRNKCPLLMVLPDSIFSEGTIGILREVGRAPQSCVTFAHPRVNPSVFDEDLTQAKSGAQLVDMVFKYPHSSFIHAEVSEESSNSYSGGISWRRLSSEYNFLSVQHRLPSPLLINPTETDLAYFKGERFDAWDHRWPSTWGGRQRYIGSSDAAFMLEITKSELNVPAINPVNLFEPDEFHKTLPHNVVNREFVSIFRGEK